MIMKYLYERISWIGFYAFLHLFILTVAYLDASIPFTPILYIVFLSLLLFGFFLIYRYHRETKFYKRLEEWDHTLDLNQVTVAESPLERIVEAGMLEQTDRLKQSASRNLVALQQEKDELLSWIHEVKTPLTAMRLMIDRLGDEAVKVSLTYEWLRIHLLLDQQLHQKRLPFMENDIFIEQVDIEEVLITEIKTLQTWCIQKGIGFDLQLEEKEVLSDAKWLAFILRQLLTNAVKYSDHHAPDIIVRSFERGGQSFIEVQDFGRGIPVRDLPRIFDKGFTSTTNHLDRNATGMGLYLANKAAQSLLIQISVISEPGAGTVFTLAFPRRNAFTRITGM